MSNLPQTPEQLLEVLCGMFPDFRQYHGREVEAATPTYHSVLRVFTCFFGTGRTAFSENQMRALAELVNGAVTEGGLLENAIGTCMLEHLRQIGCERILRPHLSKLARQKTHA